MPLTISYHEELIESLKDPMEAAAYLNAAFEDGDPNVLLLCLKDVTEAYGGIGKLSRKSNLNRENLYRILSKKGNPELYSLDKILHALGFRLAVEVNDSAN